MQNYGTIKNGQEIIPAHQKRGMQVEMRLVQSLVIKPGFCGIGPIIIIAISVHIHGLDLFGTIVERVGCVTLQCNDDFHLGSQHTAVRMFGCLWGDSVHFCHNPIPDTCRAQLLKGL